MSDTIDKLKEADRLYREAQLAYEIEVIFLNINEDERD
jgi:hypothetical protein